MSFDYRIDSTRNPYAQRLDDISLDAWSDEEEDREWEMAMERNRYRRALDQQREASVVAGSASRSPSSPEAFPAADRAHATHDNNQEETAA